MAEIIQGIDAELTAACVRTHYTFNRLAIFDRDDRVCYLLTIRDGAWLRIIEVVTQDRTRARVCHSVDLNDPQALWDFLDSLKGQYSRAQYQDQRRRVSEP